MYNETYKQFDFIYKRIIIMDSEIKELIQVFDHTRSLSDIIIWSHLILEQESVFDLSSLYNGEDHTKLEHDIDINTRFVMNRLISVREYKKELIHMMIDGDNFDKNKIIKVCLLLLISYDRTNLEEKKFIDILMEDDSTFCDYKIYFNPPNGLLNESVLTKKLRQGELYDKKNLSSLYQTFFIRKAELDFPIKIKHYQSKEFSDYKDKLKVAVCPIKEKEWFDFKIKEDPLLNLDGSFEILDRKEDLINNNNAIVKAIQIASERKADIIIFPEITMNSETEKEVGKWIACQKVCGQELGVKLIFLGSVWKNNQNTCSLLSNTGKVILRNKKNHPFEYCKKGKRFLEKLQSPNNHPLTIVDIDGLGRITYMICRDALENVEQSYIWHSYKINGEFISAYSNSLSYFKKISRNFAETNHGYTFLVNSCAAQVKEEYPVGFISTPGRNIKEGNISDVILHDYYKNGCKSCEFASCLFVFELNFQESQVYSIGDKEVESIVVTSQKYSI